MLCTAGLVPVAQELASVIRVAFHLRDYLVSIDNREKLLDVRRSAGRVRRRWDGPRGLDRLGRKYGREAAELD
jgi:hypothetical protein